METALQDMDVGKSKLLEAWELERATILCGERNSIGELAQRKVPVYAADLEDRLEA